MTKVRSIEQRRGGWFVFWEQPSEGASGPWATEEAAQAASRGAYVKAREIERAHLSSHKELSA